MKQLTLRHYSPNYVLWPEKEQFCSYSDVVICANLYIFHAPSTNGWVPSNFMVKSHQIKWTGGPCPNIVQSICRGRGHMCFIYSYCLIYCSQCSFIVLQIENNSNHNIFMAVSLFAVLIAVVWRFYSLFLGTTW